MKPSPKRVFHNHKKQRKKQITKMKNKEEKIAIATAILGILLIGIVSAGLLDYFGKITGSVEVEGPVFYATKNISNEYLEHYSLALNEFDGESGYVTFPDGLENQWFVSEELEVDSFYAADYNFDVEICAKNKTVNDTIGQVALTLKVLEEGGDFREGISCIAYVNDIPTIESCVEENYNIYHTSCSMEELELEPTDKFVLITNDGAHAITYYIRLDGDTKFKITAA